MMDPNDYPLFNTDERFSIQPQTLFRIEDQIFELDNVSVIGSAILLFTGVVAYEEDREDMAYLQCIPVKFYGNASGLLESVWGNQALWIEVESIKAYVN